MKQNVVLEYEFKAYGEPDILEAFGLGCTVACNESGLWLSGDLMTVRASLDDAGFERQELVKPAGRTHKAGRWLPTWREVWTRPQVADENPLALSPRAQQAGAARATRWQATVARTQAEAVVMRPDTGSRQQMRNFAEWVKANLTAFAYDSQEGYWKAPLGELKAAVEALEWANLSDGARRYLGMGA